MSSPGSADPNGKDKKKGRARSTRAPAPEHPVEQARRANLEADTRLKNAQAQSLEDEHALFASERRGRQLDNQLKELRRGVTLIVLVVMLSLLTAEATLAVVAPAHHPLGDLLARVAGVLLGR
jgi:hypothetical protein